MKKINFLIKLKTEGKLEIVEPSENIKDSYVRKSASNVESSKILLSNNKLEESISLTYYSMYHMLTALLFKIGIKCENHAGSIIIMKELFNLDNSEISEAKEERVDKQYYTNFEITKGEVLEAIKSAENFNSKLLDFISRLGSKDITLFRENFIQMIR